MAASKKTYHVEGCRSISDIEVRLNAIAEKGGDIIAVLPWGTSVQAVIVYSMGG